MEVGHDAKCSLCVQFSAKTYSDWLKMNKNVERGGTDRLKMISSINKKQMFLSITAQSKLIKLPNSNRTTTYKSKWLIYKYSLQSMLPAWPNDHFLVSDHYPLYNRHIRMSAAKIKYITQTKHEKRYGYVKANW